MARFKNQFLRELKSALIESRHAQLAESVDGMVIHSYVRGRRSLSQFIYVAHKASLPRGALQKLILRVPGLSCIFVHDGRIAAIEVIGRNVLDPGAANE
jgi:hypothetical protein